MERIGLDADNRRQSGHSLFTLEAHINYLHEVKLGTEVWVRTQIISFDHKRLHIYHRLHRDGFDEELAASKQILLNVDLAGPKSAPFSAACENLLATLLKGQGALPSPRWKRRAMSLGTPNWPLSNPAPSPG